MTLIIESKEADTTGAPCIWCGEQTTRTNATDEPACEPCEPGREGYPDPEDVAGYRERERAIQWREVER